MIRSRHLRGSLVLATAAAAALAACGKGGESTGDGDGDVGDGDGDVGDGDGDVGDGDGDSGGTSGDGDGDSGGSTASGGGTSTGGDGNLGGMGGMGDMGPTKEEIVDEFCPDPAEEYFIYEGTAGDDTFPDVLGTTKTAVVTDGGNDDLGYVKYGTHTACLVTGDGEDSITITGEGSGSGAAENSSDVGLGFIVLGDGADVVNYEVNTSDWYSYRPPATIADFESGVDKLRFELEANRLPSTTLETSVVITSEFTSGTVSPHNSCQTAKIYIDTDDGEVWLSHYCEGSLNELLMTVEGDVPDLGDIEIYYREVADTPELAADQVCMDSTDYYDSIVEGTEGADDFAGYYGMTRTLTLGYGADDVFSSPSTESGGPGQLGCMVGGYGDDTFNVTISLASLGQTEFFGGPGTDVLDYASTNDGTPVDGPGTRATMYLRDFKSGVDKLRFSQTAVDLLSTNVAESVIFSPTDFNAGTVQTYESCDDYKLVVDQTDGEIWMSRNYCENTDNHNMLLVDSLGDVPTADDIVIY